MDALTELLRIVKLDSAIYFNAEMSEPWCLAAPRSREIAHWLTNPEHHVIIYHLLWEGTAYAQMRDGEAVPLAPGDVVCFPHGDEHLLGSGVPGGSLLTAGSRALGAKVDVVLPEMLERNLEVLRLGGGGPRSRFICGFLACDRDLAQAFLQGLPDLIRVSIKGDETGVWLENSLKFAVGQGPTRDAGTRAMLAKLSEVLFAETLRRFARDLPLEHKGWFASLRDPSVGRALGLLIKDPGRPWTLAELAQESGVSRTVLAERFRHFLGESPMAYLTRWRLGLGARALASTNQSVAQIAIDVGYESESAFNRAFKRQYSLPPARYRRERGRFAPGAGADERQAQGVALK